MGTRGLFGFLYNGRYYLVYNQYDSYPSGLGLDLVKEIVQMLKDGQLAEWLEMFKKLKIVTEESDAPTKEDVEKLTPYTDLDVSYQSVEDWYCLTRECQGSFLKVLKSGYLFSYLSKEEMENGCGTDIMIEYIYVLDFDHNTFICKNDPDHVYPLNHLSVAEWELHESDDAE